MKKQKICRKMYGTPRRKTRAFRIGSMSSLLLFRMKTNALGTYSGWRQNGSKQPNTLV